MHQPLPLSGSLLAERQVPKQAAAQACKRPSSHRPVQAHAQAGTGRGEPYPVVHAQAQAGNGSGKQAGKGPSMVIGWHRCWLSSCFCLCSSLSPCLSAYFCFSVCVVSRCSSAFVCLSLTSLCLLRLHALTLFLPLSYCFTTVYAFTSVSAGTSVSVFTSVPFASDSAFTSVSVYLQASVFVSLNETMNLLSALLSLSVYQF